MQFVKDDTLADPDLNFGLVDLGFGGKGGWQWTLAWDNNNQITSKTMDQFAVFNKTIDITAAANRSLLLHEIGNGRSPSSTPAPTTSKGIFRWTPISRLTRTTTNIR